MHINAPRQSASRTRGGRGYVSMLNIGVGLSAPCMRG